MINCSTAYKGESLRGSTPFPEMYGFKMHYIKMKLVYNINKIFLLFEFNSKNTPLIYIIDII